MKTAFLLVAILACVSFAAGLTRVESSEAGITFDLNAAVPEFGSVVLQGTEFTSVSMAGAENLEEAGLPRLPVYRAWIEIPVGAEVVANVSELRIETISHDGGAVVPAVLSASKNDPRDSYTVSFDSDVYSGGSAYPENWVRIVYAGGMRGRNLALVEVTPLRWNAAQGDFTLLASAGISLEFQGGDIAASYEQASRLASPGYENILQNTVVNYGTYEGGMDTGPAPYLIIGHSDFVTTGMDAFVAHKEALGYTVTMVDLSVTGSTAAEIRTYIQTAINSGTEYVLLVGDTAFLPGGSATTYSDVTDLYYACLDDGGWIPDAFLGRFSVTTTGEAVLMAQRVIDYENTVGVQGWIQNALFIASSDNSSVSEGTHNYCISNYLDPRGYNSTKVYPSQGGTAADAIPVINGGISMLTFSGHGSQTSWADMSFSSSNFAQLNNDPMLPGVLSHACLTGAFSTSTCWAETWTRTPGRGGLWFWGSVPSTYWGEDDYQEKGEYEAFLGNDIYWPKGFLNQGLMAVYAAYSGGGRTQYYFEGYTLFGDPSLTMKTWPMTGIEDSSTGIVDSPVSVTTSNPVYSSVSVTLTGTGGPALVEVFDISGRVIDTPFQENLNGTSMFTWDASSLSTGVYFMRLTQGSNIATSRVSVIR
ncbi:MAG: T9SS type A sorting domain-containing protein [Candidatus Fermentibacteraceae bacterium]|nr:T9SS type A sorting domain-containing protein [Candidatus Fermentibacteraceae bacterium]